MSIFYIVAAGPSFLDVTEDEWGYLKNKNTISFARVPYGKKKTKYYFSIEGDSEDFPLYKPIFEYMKQCGYLDTILLLSKSNAVDMAKKMQFNKVYRICQNTFYFLPSRRPWFVDEDGPPHKFNECRAKTFFDPIFRFRGQLTAVINACLILGATEIRLIGVDLNSQYNFYDLPKFYDMCEDKHILDEYYKCKSLCNARELYRHLIRYPKNFSFNPESMHTTNLPYTEIDRWGDRKLRGVSDVIQWMDKELKEEGLEGIFITNKDSLLYRQNKLNYRGIDESYPK